MMNYIDDLVGTHTRAAIKASKSRNLRVTAAAAAITKLKKANIIKTR